MPGEFQILRIERKTWRSGCSGMFLLVWGGGFGLAGLIVLLVAKAGVGDNPEAGWVIGPTFIGLGFFGLGLAVFFLGSRWETLVDSSRGVLSRRWALLGLSRERRWSLDSFERVELRIETVHHHEGGARSYYAVNLCGSGSPAWVIHTTDEGKARGDADRVAKYLDLELHDHTPLGESPRIRRPEEIGVFVPQRIAERTGSLDLPDRPADLRSTIEPDGQGGFSITLPLRGFTPLLRVFAVVCLIVVLLMTAVFGFVWYQSRNFQPPPPPLIRAMMLIPPVLVAAVCGFLVLGAARVQVRVHVWPTGLTGGICSGMQFDRPLAETGHTACCTLRLVSSLSSTPSLRVS